ncbi:hypothetical protein J4E90_009647 [Alternaria incomplexa]|uniref:uncharacterized protein n=1 Tax=Alternaria incomplexa TaxID=1187928 RepID=UPI00221E7741|nr:uncharacterized protein J4E90_009647 [Alternaria incomplexa]KAI4907145.1 hypothetical protein J4E90_009647 [Alternaria incomplexa]
MPPKRKDEAITTAKPAKRVKTGGTSTRTHPLNKPAGDETPANSNVKKRKPQRRLYQSPQPTTATVDGTASSPFMALPTELRCQIYNYLADIVYDPVFPEPGICSWEVCRMPTALLQLNKTIYEEVKHPAVQKPLQKVNDELAPKMILGPTRAEIDPVYVALSDTFHLAGKQLRTCLDGPQKHSTAVKYVSLKIASWYNDTYLPQQVQNGSMKASSAQIKCKTKHLHKFVKQTLRRMALRNICEIRIRLLSHPLGPLHKRKFGIGAPFCDHTEYERLAAKDNMRKALSVGMKRELKTVYPSQHAHVNHTSILTMMSNGYLAHGMTIKFSVARARDRRLFDRAKSLC